MRLHPASTDRQVALLMWRSSNSPCCHAEAFEQIPVGRKTVSVTSLWTYVRRYLASIYGLVEGKIYETMDFPMKAMGVPVLVRLTQIIDRMCRV